MLFNLMCVVLVLFSMTVSRATPSPCDDCSEAKEAWGKDMEKVSVKIPPVTNCTVWLQDSIDNMYKSCGGCMVSNGTHSVEWDSTNDEVRERVEEFGCSKARREFTKDLTFNVLLFIFVATFVTA